MLISILSARVLFLIECERSLCPKLVDIFSWPHLDVNLRLEELDILGKIKGILPTVAHHVCVQGFVRGFENFHQIQLIRYSTEGVL